MTAQKREKKKRDKQTKDLSTIIRLGRSPLKSATKPYDVVKVFSATKARDRESLGSRVTAFLRGFSGSCVGKVVRLSSDNAFHCLTIVLFMKRGD